MVVNVGSSAQVSRVREGLENSGGSGAGNGAGIHFAENHAGGFKEAERGVYGQEFAGGTTFEQVCVIHAEPICPPV